MSKFENHQSTAPSPKSFPDILTSSHHSCPQPKHGIGRAFQKVGIACTQGEMCAQISTLRHLSRSHVEGALVEKYGRRSSYERW